MSRRFRPAALILAGAMALASCSVLLPGDDRPGSGGARGEQTAASSTSSGAGFDSLPGQQLADAVSAQALQETLREIEGLTMAAEGNRGPGSAGYLATAEWIEDQLADTGFYEIYRQDFTIQLDHPGRSKLVDGQGQVINQRPLRFSPGTPDAGVGGRLVEPANGNGCQVADWGEGVRGQVGLVERGGCLFEQLNASAAQAGAVLLVVVNTDSGGLYGTLDHARTGDIPMTGITAQAGRELRDRLDAAEVRLSFSFEQRIDEYQTFNLFAETLGGRADNVVMAGAHLDSVPDGPGINDNGSGSAVLLETALRLADGEQPTNKVRFAWWGGEEWGLLGAIHWVNGKVADDQQALTALAAYINIDMVASPNYVIGVYDGDASSYSDPEPTAGSDRIEALFGGYLDAIGQPWIDSEIGSASDHGAFMNSGVPVGGLFTGAEGPKTPEEVELFGGRVNGDYDSNYHTGADSFANLSTEALVINGRATAYVIGALAADSSVVNGAQPGNQGTPTLADGFGYAAAF